MQSAAQQGVGLQVVILVILLGLSAFFSSAETALTTVNKIKMRSFADDGNKRAKMVMKLTEHSGKMLSAILIGNNIVNLSASSLTTTIAYELARDVVGPIASYAVAIATGIITILILIFGEIAPKTVATINSEKLSLVYAYPIHFIMTVLTPISFLINILARIILFVLRVDPNAKPDAMTEDELRTIVEVSHESGVIEEEEREMINNVFDLGDAKAKDVMVPRVNVVFADVESSYDELIDIFREHKFTRLPVYEETTDNVIGTINMKDLLLYNHKEDFHIREFLREAYFTYEHKVVSELLVEMREASYNIAIVLDEYGETAGLITLEDILEEIVGEIHDEYDEYEEDELLTRINDFEYILEGSISLDDLDDRLELKLESDEYDSLGGFIIENLDRHPEIGDEITTEKGLRLVVDSLDKNRVEKVHIFIPEDFYLEEDEDEEMEE
ncbi:MAG: HlyC/CorC family transporter [Tyzzerella sp.]|nr:HlyC/CorC family transporter [Tyzzerella sp.]